MGKRRSQKIRSKKRIKSRTKRRRMRRNSRNCGGGDPLTPLNISNGTLEGRDSIDSRATLPINELKGNPPQEDCPISNLHRCKQGLSVPKEHTYVPPALQTEPLTPSPREEEGSHSMMFTEQFEPFMREHYPEETTGFIYEELYFRSSEPTKTTINVYKHDVEQCAYITIKNEEEIYLDQLNKCGEHSGTQVLQMIEEFAKQYGYKTITLQDASNIMSTNKRDVKCRIPLALLMILATGQTWYNSKEYKSPYFDIEIDHNSRIIEKPAIKFLEDIMVRLNIPADEQEQNALQLVALNIMPINETVTVRELFSAIKEKMGRTQLNCDEHPLHKWLSNILINIVKKGGSNIRFNKDGLDPNDIPDDNIIFLWYAKLTKNIV